MMHTHPVPKQKAPAGQLPVSAAQRVAKPVFQFADKRPEAVLQRKLQETVAQSSRVMQLQAVQRMAESETESVPDEQAHTSSPEPVQMMPKQVQNLVGTSKRKCNCTGPLGGTWLGHWRKKHGALPLKCSASYCKRPVQVGAHVRRLSRDGRVPYIVPFCKYHNKRKSTQIIRLKKGSKLRKASMNKCY